MTKQQQLLEEAGRLRRLSLARRVDFGWAYLTQAVSQEEIARRAAESNGWMRRAQELEAEALRLAGLDVEPLRTPLTTEPF